MAAVAPAAATAPASTPHQHHPSAGLARWTPTLPTNLINLINPFATIPTTGNESPRDHAKSATTVTTESLSHNDPSAAAASVKKQPLFSALPLGKRPPPPESPSRSNSSAMFAEPESSRSSDGGSREGSVDGRRAKKTTRPKTQFSICHPPPESKARQKLHRRPRSLLQLHRLSVNARPQPALEVIPSANFSVRLTRAITRVFKTKHGLCSSDLVVLKAESYSTEEADEDQEVQDVIGIICNGRINGEDKQAGKTRIHTAGGAEWEAYPASNGGYEFSSTDEHGLEVVVRWVPKKKKEGGITKTKDGNRRFNFSTISPSSRRHPVIASMSSTGLDINDRYKIPEPAAITPLSSPMLNAVIDDEIDEDGIEELDQVETDDRLREIVTLTAIFVAFKEGWSPSFKYDDKDKESSSPVKSITSTVDTPPGSPIPFPLEKRNSMKSISSGIIRRSSVLSRSNRNSTASVPELDEPEDATRRSVSISKPGRSRADSASTVLVHRAASNRRKNNTQATWRPDMLPAKEPLQETSREDLTREMPTPLKSPSPLSLIPQATTELPENVSQPHIPEESGSGANLRTRISVDQLEVPRGHRESTTTTDTSASSSPAGKTVAPHPLQNSKTVKRRSGWRRLFCGGSNKSPA